jgi:hypothetical protein
MEMAPGNAVTDPKLARDWLASKLLASLQRRSNGDRHALVSFLRSRHEERFFRPIRALQAAPQNWQGYGFSIMALSCLLVETIQSFRLGLPSTHQGELRKLKRLASPAQYAVHDSEWPKKGADVFEAFFRKYQGFFPGLSGNTFYADIRNGLLHQAQTKGGWQLRTRQPHLCDSTGKIIDRDRFAQALRLAFDDYMNELASLQWQDDLWLKAARKLWWLARLSRP